MIFVFPYGLDHVSALCSILYQRVKFMENQAIVQINFPTKLDAVANFNGLNSQRAETFRHAGCLIQVHKTEPQKNS